jgi:hypothetical protein
MTGVTVNADLARYQTAKFSQDGGSAQVAPVQAALVQRRLGRMSFP